MPDLVSAAIAFFTVLAIDIALAGDNAITVGIAAAGLPADQRKKTILYGVMAAAVLRIIFALIAVQLLAILGLTLAGGVLLIWVCWKMYRDLKAGHHLPEQGNDGTDGTPARPAGPQKTMRQAIVQIVVADLSMSLDNVLAVAGAAQDHPYILVLGLVLSVLLMGAAANFIAKAIEKHSWIAWGGLLIVFGVACKMIWEGGHDVLMHLG